MSSPEETEYVNLSLNWHKGSHVEAILLKNAADDDDASSDSLVKDQVKLQAVETRTATLSVTCHLYPQVIIRICLRLIGSRTWTAHNNLVQVQYGSWALLEQVCFVSNVVNGQKSGA